MANINHDAILTRVREVLESGLGTLRTIASTRFRGGLPRDLDESEESLRAADRPLVEAEIAGEEPHPASPNVYSNLALRTIDVNVRVVRHLDPSHKLKDDIRDDVKGLERNDGDVIAQALTYPGNLTQTSGAVSTGLVSGMLQYVRSDPPVIQQETEAARITTTHRFRGVVQVTLAVA